MLAFRAGAPSGSHPIHCISAARTAVKAHAMRNLKTRLHGGLKTPTHMLAACATVGLALSACGGGGGAADAPAAPVPPANTLSGSVAVGAPMTDGRLRVLDANGAVVAADVAIAANGSYPAVTLTGPAPWRLEACGYSGAAYQCIRSVAQSAGTAQITPLTNALLLLASGQSPESLMSGAAPALTSTALATAQDTLRAGLAPVLADAGLGATFDLFSGSLVAGSRTGYDRLLDAVGVSTGVDSQPFVQIEPRLGSGNLYLEQGSTALGTLATHGAAASLPLAGLEDLFGAMTAAIRSTSTCTDATTGLAASMAVDATFAGDDGQPLVGPSAVGAALCGFLAGGDGEPVRLGSHFLSPTLGRCDFSGSVPVCGVSFVLQGADGSIEPVGQGMGVSYTSNGWKFKGDLLPVAIHASARVQRDRRIDGPAVVDSYSRALAFEIPALAGLACARVAQHDASGAEVTLAFYKPHAADGLRSLSAWRISDDGASRSLDPTAGITRTSDDSWLMLPQGAEGDTAVRNFFRGGRSVSISLFSDSSCSTAFTVGGRSRFEVDVAGVPPVWASLPGLPWPSLGDSSQAALRSVAVGANSSLNFSASWSVPGGSVGVDGLSFCSDRALCGQGDSGRLGETGLRGAATSASVTLRTGAQALAVGDYKMLAIYGSLGDGTGMQSNHMSCPAVAAGLSCEH
jgi:hypothetical protein